MTIGIYGYQPTDISGIQNQGPQTVRGFTNNGNNPPDNLALGLDYIGAVNEEIKTIYFAARRGVPPTDGEAKVALYDASDIATPGNLLAASPSIVVNTDTYTVFSYDVNIAAVPGTRYKAAVGYNDGAFLSTRTGFDCIGQINGVEPEFLDPWPAPFAYNGVMACWMEVVSTGPVPPTLTEPSTVTGDGVYAGVGTQLTTTEATIRHEFSRDNFATIHGFKDYPVDTATSTGFNVTVDAGFEQAISGQSPKSMAMHTDANWKSRWMYKDDAGDPLTLEFAHNPQAGYSVYPAAKSDYDGKPESQLHNIQEWMSDFDQLYLDDSITGGVPDPLTADYADPDHPLPNYFGGDSETYDGPVKFAIGIEYDYTARPMTGTKTPYGYGGLYVNSYLSGGAASGPIGGNNPPTAHGIIFNTVESGPVAIDKGFKWVMNEAKDSGRCVMTYDIATNNPNLEVGETYVYTVNVLADASTIVATFVGATNMTINNIVTNSQANVLTEIKIEFTITALGYGATIRCGVGVTTNRTDRMEVSGASIVKKPSVNSYTEEYTGEYQ